MTVKARLLAVIPLLSVLALTAEVRVGEAPAPSPDLEKQRFPI